VGRSGGRPPLALCEDAVLEVHVHPELLQEGARRRHRRPPGRTVGLIATILSVRTEGGTNTRKMHAITDSGPLGGNLEIK